jgi:hypothetical protein
MTTKVEREARFKHLTRTYGVQGLADLVIQLEEALDKRRPRKPKKQLSKRVREGLRAMAGVARAGDPGDFLGCTVDVETGDIVEADAREDWKNVEAAIAWISELPNEKR